MLKHLHIQNFKCWKDTGKIRMAPISLFLGTNSSGKSSIGQFLMMLKQTVESQDRWAVFYPGGKNSAVELGAYEQMVFHHDLKNQITFDYQWSLPEKLKITDPLTAANFSGDELSFYCAVEMNNATLHRLQVSHFKYQLIHDKTSMLSVKLERDNGQEYKASAEQYELRRKQGRAWALKDIVRFYGFPDEAITYYQNADFLQDLNLAQEKLFSTFYYLGPLRTKTDRLYTWGGIAPQSVGFSGENTIAAMLAGRNRKISLGYKLRAKPLEEIIAQKLKEMGLIEDLEVNRISEQRRDYEIKVKTKGSSDWVDLPDVGFGISQVLPVLVQCFYAPPGSIILVEQPEIHLHPSAQSVLADVMIDVINARENGENRNVQVIIETHSEHFLRRLQRRIAEDVISEEKVAAYFADVTKPLAVLEPLQIDPLGNIKNWPENFFGDEMGDVIGQAKAAMKKRKQKAQKKPSERAA